MEAEKIAVRAEWSPVIISRSRPLENQKKIRNFADNQKKTFFLGIFCTSLEINTNADKLIQDHVILHMIG